TMRRARSGSGARLARAHVNRTVVRLVLRDRGGTVHVSELDVEIAHEGLAPLGTEARIRAQNVSGAGLLDGQLRDRPALGLIGVEERARRFAFQDTCELPGQVVGVLNTCVASEAAG